VARREYVAVLWLVNVILTGQSGRVERAELQLRLLALGASVENRLTDEQRRWFAEFVDVGEYQLALETVADWLSEDARPISEAERREARALADAMGNADRVVPLLDSCPRTHA
jgi:hypothetical protein